MLVLFPFLVVTTNYQSNTYIASRLVQCTYRGLGNIQSVLITNHITLNFSKSQSAVTATTMMATSHTTPTSLTPPSRYVPLLYSSQ